MNRLQALRARLRPRLAHATAARRPTRQQGVSYLDITAVFVSSLAIIAVTVASTLTLYQFVLQDDLVEWPEPLRDHLRRGLQARKDNDLKTSALHLEQAWKVAMTLPLTAFGPDPLLRFTDIAIIYADVLESETLDRERDAYRVLISSLTAESSTFAVRDSDSRSPHESARVSVLWARVAYFLLRRNSHMFGYTFASARDIMGHLISIPKEAQNEEKDLRELRLAHRLQTPDWVHANLATQSWMLHLVSSMGQISQGKWRDAIGGTLSATVLLPQMIPNFPQRFFHRDGSLIHPFEFNQLVPPAYDRGLFVRDMDSCAVHLILLTFFAQNARVTLEGEHGDPGMAEQLGEFINKARTAAMTALDLANRLRMLNAPFTCDSEDLPSSGPKAKPNSRHEGPLGILSDGAQRDNEPILAAYYAHTALSSQHYDWPHPDETEPEDGTTYRAITFTRVHPPFAATVDDYARPRSPFNPYDLPGPHALRMQEYRNRHDATRGWGGILGAVLREDFILNSGLMQRDDGEQDTTRNRTGLGSWREWEERERLVVQAVRLQVQLLELVHQFIPVFQPDFQPEIRKEPAT